MQVDDALRRSARALYGRYMAANTGGIAAGLLYYAVAWRPHVEPGWEGALLIWLGATLAFNTPVILLIYRWMDRPIRAVIADWDAGRAPDPGVLLRARQRVLNMPVLHARMAMQAWSASALYLLAWSWLSGGGVPVWLGWLGALACVVSGSVTLIFVYYSAEYFVQTRWMPVFFAGRRASDIPGVTAVPVWLKLINFFLTAALAPTVILALTSIYMPPTAGLMGFTAGFSAVVGMAQLVLILRSVSLPLGRLKDAMGRMAEGRMDTRLAISGPGTFGRIEEGFNAMADGMAERDFIKQTFGRYVSQQVMEEILSGDVGLGGQRRHATIMFTDIRGFTTISETLPPERIVEMLNAYFDAMVDCILRHEGTLDKFIGDGMLAVFGLLREHHDDEDRAVRCALEMMDRLGPLNARWKEEGLPEIRIGAGIHTGDVVVGNIGSAKMMQYTVVGDTVNVASRIEQLNKDLGSHILISDSTRSLLKGRYALRAHEGVRLKGKSAPVTLWQVDGAMPPKD